MKIGVIGEGETEYNCLPTLVSKLGHIVVGVYHIGGAGTAFPWSKLMLHRIYPYVRGFAVKRLENRPDRTIIVLDREARQECCGSLATDAQALLSGELAKENLAMPTSVVLANRQFECWLMADVAALDASPLLKSPISHLLVGGTDEKNVLGIIKSNLKRGCAWDKSRYGKALAKRLDVRKVEVLANSRSFRKFVKELTRNANNSINL